MQAKNFSIPQAFTFAVNALSSWQNLSKFILLHAISSGIIIGGFVMLALITTGIHLKYIFNAPQFINFYKNYFATAGIPLIILFVFFVLFAYVIYLFVAFCSVKMSLDIYDTGKANLRVAIETVWRTFFKLLSLSILVLLGMIAGLIFLIIPGVIFTLASLFSIYILIDKNNGIMEALRASWALTKGIRMKLFGFLMLLGLVVGISGALLNVLFRAFFLWQALFAIIRHFVAPILSHLMFAFIYRSLQKTKAKQISV